MRLPAFIFRWKIAAWRKCRLNHPPLQTIRVKDKSSDPLLVTKHNTIDVFKLLKSFKVLKIIKKNIPTWRILNFNFPANYFWVKKNTIIFNFTWPFSSFSSSIKWKSWKASRINVSCKCVKLLFCDTHFILCKVATLVLRRGEKRIFGNI